MIVPCTNHDACPLNLTLLRAAIKKAEATHRETEFKFKEAEKTIGTDAYNWRTLDGLRSKLAYEADDLHNLYAARAHHRGKLHATKRYNEPGRPEKGTYAITLDAQESIAEDVWARFKKVPKIESAA